MPVTSTTAAVAIKAGELTKAIMTTVVRTGESRIVPRDWDAIAAACKGEVTLLAALKIVDKRTGTK